MTIYDAGTSETEILRKLRAETCVIQRTPRDKDDYNTDCTVTVRVRCGQKRH